MARRYQVISGDSHMEISPERWTPRVPAAWRERAPKLVKLSSGGDGWIIESRTPYVLGLAVTGKPYQEHRLNGITYEGSPGAGSPEQRVREQDTDGIDAEVIFTSVVNPRMWRALPDDGYKALVRSYNEFLGEEYCAAAPDRLLAMGVIPTTGVDDAIGELEYCKRMGLKGVSLAAFPSGKTFPTPDDDRFWKEALDLPMPIAIHVGMGGEGPIFRYKREPSDVPAFGNDPVGQLTRFQGNSTRNIIQLAYAGVLDRFPRLRVYFAETMIGWLPYSLEQIDDIYERSRYWAETYYGLEPLPRLPSDYIRKHAAWGFLRDPFGVEMRHRIGIRNAIWGNDFPHSAGDWPNSRKVIEETFAGVPEEERYAMLAGNAVEFFGLDNEGEGIEGGS